jgi:two-component sensor histidine kinase
MTAGGPHSERILILAPRGRDAAVANQVLREVGQATLVCDHLGGAACAVVTEEALAFDDLSGLSAWIKAQPAWSDFPFLLLTARGDRPDRNVLAARYQDLLGNVTFLERPFHSTTLVSVTRAAVRSRRRQYEARGLLDRQQLLVHEVQHRSKNLLAVVQSIASSSLPECEERDVYFGRLQALAEAQDLLSKSDKLGAPLKDVISQALKSFPDRVHIEVADVFLNAKAAQNFVLIMYELTTNALKYGALSTVTGSVCVECLVEDISGDRVVRLRWRERGGPPVTPPVRKGFGSMLLEHAVAHADPPRL